MSLERVLQLNEIDKLYILKYNFKQPFKSIFGGIPLSWKIEYLILESNLLIILYTKSIVFLRKLANKSQYLIPDNRFNRV